VLVRDPGGRVAARLRVGNGLTVEKVAFSPDGSLLAAAASSSSIRTTSQVAVWATAGWRRRGAVSLEHRSPIALAFTPDGGQLVVAAGTAPDPSRILRLRAAYLTLLGKLGQHPSTVRALALSPDGRTLATVTAADPLVRLWDARTGAPLAQLTGHDGYSNAVAFSPEGGLLASGGQDGRPSSGRSTRPGRPADLPGPGHRPRRRGAPDPGRVPIARGPTPPGAGPSAAGRGSSAPGPRGGGRGPGAWRSA
jgi:WD40 repeat protein